MTTVKLLPQVFSRLSYFIAFGFGAGLLKPAPGTWGTVVGVLIYGLIFNISITFYLIFTILYFIIALQAASIVTRELGVEDFSGIVCDEIVGYLITMFLAPVGFIWAIYGFIVFRFFDILKPFPINLLEKKIKGGMGVMLDDVMAGIFAFIVVQFTTWII